MSDAAGRVRTERPAGGAIRRALPAIGLVALILVAWELACRLLAVDPLTLPAPSRIGSALWDARAAAVGHGLTTLGETVLGFGLSVVFAVTVAVVMDQIAWVRRAVYPLLVASQTVPIVAVAPLFILWFGIGLLPKVLVVVLVTFFPIAVALLDGLAATPADATALLESMGASRRDQLVKLRLPGAMPALVHGAPDRGDLRGHRGDLRRGGRCGRWPRDLDRAVQEPVPDRPRVRGDPRHRRC